MDADTRVYMAADMIYIFLIQLLVHIMNKTKSLDLQAFVVYDQVHCFELFLRAHIMISHHQVHCQFREIVPPFHKPLVLLVAIAVEKIADKYDFFWLEILYLLP